jgi:lipoprotein NlpI
MLDLDKTIQMEPRNSVAFLYRGLVKDRTGDVRGALEDLSRSIEIAPMYSLAFTERGILKERADDLKGAIADYDRAINNQPIYRPINIELKDVRSYRRRSYYLYDTGFFTKALADFRRLYEIDPVTQDESALRIWLIRGRLGEQQTANRELKEHMKTRRPESSNGHWTHIASYLTDGLSEVALLEAAGGEGTEAKGRAYFYVASKHLIRRDKTTALRCFTKCVEFADKQSPEYRSAKAEIEMLSPRQSRKR